MLLCSCRCKADAWIYIFFRRMSVFHSRWLLIAGAVLNRWARAKQALRLRPTVWACWPVGRLLHASSHLISSNIHQSRSISVVQNPNGYLSPKHVGTWPNLPRLSSKSQSWLEHGQAAGQRKDVWHCEIVSGFRWWGLTLDTGLKEGENHFSRYPGPHWSVSWPHGSRDKSLGRMPPPHDCLRIQACAKKGKCCSRYIICGFRRIIGNMPCDMT